MSNLGRTLLVKILKLFDLGLMSLSFVAATMATLRHGTPLSLVQFLSLRIKIHNFAILIIFIAVWHSVLTAYSLYNSRRLSRNRQEVIDVIRATSTIFIFIGAYAFSVKMVTPLFILIFWLSSMISTAAARLVLRAVLRIARIRGRNLRDIIIVGTNKRAVEFATKLARHPELGYRIVGFVDRKDEGMERLRFSCFELTTDFSGFPDFLRKNVIDEVVMALPVRSMHGEASLIAKLCEEQGVTMRVLSSIFDLKIARAFTG